MTTPKNYKSRTSVRDTEIAIKIIKDNFERKLASVLELTRVSAPLFVTPQSGLNDNLNGIERPVRFGIKSLQDDEVEVVQSLAKWKRMALKRYNFGYGEGIYTDMNAIRRDEDLDNIHSVYVDQWDWEKIIPKEERTAKTLHDTVNKIFLAFKEVEIAIEKQYGGAYEKYLPREIFFITSQELEDLYPSLTPKQREYEISKKHKAVFISQIGKILNSGAPHDGRAPDYDDWELNGDIIFWYPPLDMALEVSSMGIRVDESSLMHQLERRNCLNRLDFEYHKQVAAGNYPYTIGGGIGQSRICMFFLGKVHIGEVQASVWPNEMIEECYNNGIHLL